MTKLTAGKTKTCSSCKIEQAFTFFSKAKSNKDGYDYTCKSCHHQKYLSRREIICERSSKWKRDNPEKRLENNRRWTSLNKEKAAACSREWGQRNRPYGAAAVARRRILERQATPLWANDFVIEEAYELAALRTKVFGFSWHVDHIVPLQGKLVCGLHVETNLQVIPAKDNLRKGNRFVSS